MNNGKRYEIRGLLLLSSLTYLWIGINLMVRHYSLSLELPTCWFKSITGLPCGGCGMTTATLEMLQGRLLTALAINPLGPIVLGFATIVLIWTVIDKACHGNSLSRHLTNWEKHLEKPLFYIPFIILVLIHWMWNIYKYSN